MKKVLLLALTSVFLFANEINWLTLDKGLEKAKKENKKVAVFMTNKYCGYCVKLEKNTLSNPKVTESLNELFVPVKIDTYNTKYPSYLEVRGTPTFYFLNSNGEKLRNKIVGYRPVGNFLEELNNILMKK